MTRELRRLSNKQFIEDIKKYINSPYEFYGTKIPELKTMAKKLHDENELKQFYRVFNNLWKSGHHDKRSLAISALQCYKDELDLETWKFLKPKLKEMKSWDQIDMVASTIIGEILLKNPLFEREIRSMAKENNIWLKRTAIMSTIPLINKGDLSLAFKFSEDYMAYKDDYVKEAIGMILREAGKKKPEQVKKFLLKHINMPPLVFNYASEDMKELRKVRKLKKLKEDGNGGFLWRVLNP